MKLKNNKDHLESTIKFEAYLTYMYSYLDSKDITKTQRKYLLTQEKKLESSRSKLQTQVNKSVLKRYNKPEHKFVNLLCLKLNDKFYV